ncbi:hypothetical protein FQR65_LT10798 [Abscondita terminalis]|nr:hypothetical protein FQR65_LT10798 [Abscondita terminalis]
MLIPKFAFDLLKDAQEAYTVESKYDVLLGLHDVFGESFVKAVELLETGTVLRYETPDNLRRTLKVSDRCKAYTLFSDINFCYCPTFKHQVLKQRNLITCKHVLAAKLAEIQNKIQTERVTNTQLVDLLNHTIEYVKN